MSPASTHDEIAVLVVHCVGVRPKPVPALPRGVVALRLTSGVYLPLSIAAMLPVPLVGLSLVPGRQATMFTRGTWPVMARGVCGVALTLQTPLPPEVIGGPVNCSPV